MKAIQALTDSSAILNTVGSLGQQDVSPAECRINGSR